MHLFERESTLRVDRAKREKVCSFFSHLLNSNYHYTSCYDYYLLLKEYKKTSQDFVYRKEQIRALVKQAKASGTVGSVNELTKQLERQLPKVEPGELAKLRDIFLHKRSPPKLIS